MQGRSNSNKLEAFKRGNAEEWTQERVAQLGKLEVQQLRDNAERLGEPELVALCDEVIKTQRRRPAATVGRVAAPRTATRHLIARSKAFAARGAVVQDPSGSWGGVRKSDGAVVMTLWAGAVISEDGSCSYLLWAPNVDGSRPWSDKAAGKERLDHCRLALQRDDTEGLLVYGLRLEGHLPEDKVRSVHGVDPETVLRFKVEQRGEEYWAVWGKKEAA